MSQLDNSLERAVFSHDDTPSIITNFNKLYSGAVYPPMEELQTLLLVAAVESKHVELVKALLNIGFPVNYKFGYSSPLPLHAAVFIGDVYLIQLLLRHNASVNLISRATLRQSDKVYSAVEFAMLSDRPDLLGLLQDSFIVGPSGYTLLHLACIHGSIECVRHLLALDQYKTLINAVDNTPKRCTAIMLSLKHGSRLVQTMLEHGAAVDQTTADYRCTILHLAASRETYSERRLRGFVPIGFADVIRMLVVAGCSVNTVDLCGETALTLLCAHAQCEIIMSARDTDISELPYEISLHRSIIHEACEVLLKAGASACGLGSQILPLGVLAQQIQILLGVLVQSDKPMLLVEQALITCHEMIVLMLSYCRNSLNGWRPELVAVNVIDMLYRYCYKVLSPKGTYDREFVDKIISVIFGIFRLLVLLGAATALHDLTSSIYNCLVVSHERFFSFLQMLINVIDENDCSLVKHHLQKLLSPNEVTDMLYVLDIFSNPRSLQQLCRVRILSCLAPVRRTKDVSSLNLPQRLADYVVLRV